MKYSLEDVDGNAYAIMGYVKNAMKREHCTKQEMDDYVADATSSDYCHLISVSLETIDRLNR